MGKLEKEWHDHIAALELLNIWAGRNSTAANIRNSLLNDLANTRQLAVMLPDYLRERRQQLTFVGTVNHAFSIAKEIGHGSAAGLAILDTILDFAKSEKKSGKNMREANKTIIDTYFFAPHGSRTELKARALMPISDEYREDIEKVRRLKFGEAVSLLQIPYSTPPAPGSNGMP